jgi:peptide/nickel transport system permease protein
MAQYLVRRLLHAVAVLLIVTLIVFVLLRALPGGTARAILGPRASKAAIDAFNRKNGFNHSVIVQYLDWLWRLLQGNLGYSYHYNEAVSTLMGQLLPKTLLLVGAATLIAVLLAVPIGLVQASRHNKPSDHIATGVEIVFYSMPAFWLGIILVLYLAVDNHFFPAEAPQGTIGQVVKDPKALVLPVATLMLITVALFSRYMRSSALATLVEDFIRTARGKGMSTGQLFMRHVIRNSLAPVVTLIGLSLPFLVGGAVVVETVFNYPGMGLAFWTAAQERDYAVLLGFTLVTGVATVIGSLLADLAVAWLDPRVRLH